MISFLKRTGCKYTSTTNAHGITLTKITIVNLMMVALYLKMKKNMVQSNLYICCITKYIIIIIYK